MSVSERDAILRERAAFLKGCVSENGTPLVVGVASLRSARAATEYPLPKITKPNEQPDAEGNLWRFTHRLEIAFLESVPKGGRGHGEWCAASASLVNRSTASAIAKVLAVPTIEVEDDSP